MACSFGHALYQNKIFIQRTKGRSPFVKRTFPSYSWTSKRLCLFESTFDVKESMPSVV